MGKGSECRMRTDCSRRNVSRSWPKADRICSPATASAASPISPARSRCAALRHGGGGAHAARDSETSAICAVRGTPRRNRHRGEGRGRRLGHRGASWVVSGEGLSMMDRPGWGKCWCQDHEIRGGSYIVRGSYKGLGSNDERLFGAVDPGQRGDGV